MARKLVKRDWGQAKGGYTPFAKSSPKAKEMPVNDTGCTCYDAFDRARGVYFTQKCENHR